MLHNFAHVTSLVQKMNIGKWKQLTKLSAE